TAHHSQIFQYSFKIQCMFHIIVFFNKVNPFKVEKISECFLHTQIIFPGKFIYTSNRKANLFLLFAHSKPPLDKPHLLEMVLRLGSVSFCTCTLEKTYSLTISVK